MIDTINYFAIISLTALAVTLVYILQSLLNKAKGITLNEIHEMVTASTGAGIYFAGIYWANCYVIATMLSRYA